jgi:diadenosine tetraphosphatase ApaH/serine/threonine PP2A family protein phosphatase
MCSKCGFLTDVKLLYPNDNIFRQFIDVFNYLPLAAILQKNIFCVHGGICPDLKKVDQIKCIRRPLADFNRSVIEGLVWSDPSNYIENYMDSPPGSGFLFGRR